MTKLLTVFLCAWTCVAQGIPAAGAGVASTGGVVSSGLVAQYDFYGGSGSTWPDSSGNGNTLTMTGTSWNADSLALAGIGTFAKTSGALISTGNSDYSVQVVMTTNSGDGFMWSQGDHNTSHGLPNGHVSPGSSSCYCSQNYNENTAQADITGGINNKILLLTCRYASSGTTVYSAISGTTYVGTGTVTANNQSSAWYLGAIASSTGFEGFVGKIYYVLVYNRKLSDAEVISNYSYLQTLWSGRGVTIL